MDRDELMDLARKRVVGFAAYCGLTLTSVEPGSVRGYCPLVPELLNPYGKAHGGAISTLMDTLSGICASSASVPYRYVVTRSADVHYLRPVTGSRIAGWARAVRAGRQMCLVQAEIYDDQDRLCASGQLEFFYVEEGPKD